MPLPRGSPSRPPLVADLAPIHPARREHLEALSGATGIMQHAVGTRPDPAHGYCTDDVARALRVDLLHQRELGWASVAGSAGRHLAFLGAAFLPSPARFRNFRSVDGTWLDDGGSADSQGRALHALGETILLAPDPAMAATARDLLARSLPAARTLTDLRARSSALLGLVAAVRAGMGGEAPATLQTLAAGLAATFGGSDAPAWPWPEPILTYENGLPVQALIAAGAHLGDAAMVAAGVRVLDWLVAVQAAPAGHLSPVGNGWWPRGGERSRFDQQPIEAAALLLAAHAAIDATGHARHRLAVEQAYGWFLGANDVGIPVAEPQRGACFDGLEPAGVNANQGAESTLAWLLSVEHVRVVRATLPIERRTTPAALRSRGRARLPAPVA
jgi:hypothetical protein